MIRFARAAALLSVVALLGACQSTVYPSESVYARHEVMQPARVERCRVLEVRQVAVGATPNTQGRYNYAPVQVEESAGAIGGAVIGAFIGSQIGSGNGKEIATALGASLGGAAGRSYGARLAQGRQTQAGVEYSILTAAGREEIVVQNRNPDDRIVQPGQTCRIAHGTGGLRVLPGEHLPGTISRPRQTAFR